MALLVNLALHDYRSGRRRLYHSPGWNKDYPRLQILTIEELLAGKQVEMPQTSISFKQAEKMGGESTDQGMLGLN